MAEITIDIEGTIKFPEAKLKKLATEFKDDGFDDAEAYEDAMKDYAEQYFKEKFEVFAEKEGFDIEEVEITYSGFEGENALGTSSDEPEDD